MTCEFKISRDLKKQGFVRCDKTAYYRWHIKREIVPMCKEHGEACAGNFTHELERLPREDRAR